MHLNNAVSLIAFILSQLAQLLPMEENFLLLFRFDNPLDSSVEFMKVSREIYRRKIGYLPSHAWLRINYAYYVFCFKKRTFRAAL